MALNWTSVVQNLEFKDRLGTIEVWRAWALVEGNLGIMMPTLSAVNCFRPHIFAGYSKTKSSIVKKQGKDNLPTPWPAISLSLFACGCLLGPLLDGIHSSVGLISYKSGAVDIGPLHTDIWVSNSARKCDINYSWACHFSTGSTIAWIILLHCWIGATSLG